MRNKKILTYLFLILILASLFRLYKITSHGLYENDEIAYYKDTIASGKSILNYLGNSTSRTFVNFLQATLPLVNAFSAKPGHILLGLWGFFVWGTQQFGFLITTVVWSLLTIIVLFLIGYKFFGYKVALMSALLLSISAIHVKFSRTYLAHIDEIFFVMLATLFYLLSKTENKNQRLSLALSGLCLGFAFTVHPQIIIFFPLFFIYEIFGYFVDKNNSLWAKFSSTIFLFLISPSPILIFVLMSGFGNLVSGLPPFSTSLKSCYLGQLFWNIGETRFYAEESSRNLNKLFLLKYFALSQGRLFTMLSILSCLVFVKYTIFRRRLVDLIILAQSGILFLYWQFLSGKEQLLRYIVVTIPFFCLAISVVLEDKDYIKYLTRTIKIGLILLLVIEGIVISTGTILIDNSPYLVMEKFFITKKAQRVLSTSGFMISHRDVLMPNLDYITIIPIQDPHFLKQEIIKNNIEYFILFWGDRWDKKAYYFKTKPELLIQAIDYPEFYRYLIIKGIKDLGKAWNNPLAKSIAIYSTPELLRELEDN